jgi:YegS/Rv2252/BmrU family lipid kinase
MRKAALLYNPDSGGSKRRQRELQSAVEILRAGGVEAELLPTESKDHAAAEARRMIDSGCDTIFACGGDGTVHNLVQVLANTPVALGVFPIGTANALAHDLRWPFRLQAAAKAALEAKPRRVALGRVSCQDIQGTPITCHFVVAAGIGLDAHLFYKLQSGIKQRLGMAAYYAKAWHMWFSYAMPRFNVQYQQSSASAPKAANVTELLAVRIRNFGGVLRELAPGASLDRDDVRLVFCHTASRIAYLSYVTAGLLRLAWPIKGIELAYAVKASCDYVSPAAEEQQARIYVEADGELIGRLPAEITVVPDALTLLTPAR